MKTRFHYQPVVWQCLKYSLSSASTNRWNVLASSLGTNLVKRLSDTRWSSLFDVVNALYVSFEKIKHALNSISEEVNARRETEGMGKKMENLATNWKPWLGVQIHFIAMWKRRKRNRSVRLTRYDGSEEEVLLSKSERYKVEVFLLFMDSLISKLTKRTEAYSLIENLFFFFWELKQLVLMS